MIPYIDLSAWPVPAFPFLVAAGVALGHWLFVRRARRLGLDRRAAGDASLCLIAGGFVGAVLGKAVYFPNQAGWHFLGLSSFGGIAGGLLAAAAYFALRRMNPWSYLDAAAFVFPSAWAFGRLGCALAHDHPGIRGEGLLTVAYPGGARYDLGLLELLFALIVILFFHWLDRGPRTPGFYFSTLFLLYGPFRVALDLLHVDPPVYLGWPVDRWWGVAAFVLGIFTLYNPNFRRCR